MYRRINNLTRNSCLAAQAVMALTFRQRLAGLIGRPGLAAGEALILEPCRSVHMFFMRFPLDIIYLDRFGTVLRSVPGLAPGRIGPYIHGAHTVIELPVGTIESTGTRTGDQIALLPAE
jgi:uncharacterized membrane protein (UPF0127 family)